MSTPIPRGVETAAAWSWRFLVVAAALAVVVWVVERLHVLVVPVAIALLLAALLSPAVDRVHRGKIGRAAATALVVVGSLTLLVGGLTLVGQQIAEGFDELSKQVVVGLAEIRNWIRDGPLGLSDDQVDRLLEEAQAAAGSQQGAVLSSVTQVGITLGHVVAGFFLVLFSLFFFLYEGGRIWGWVVRLFPTALRRRVDSSGRVAWVSLTSFVRATVLVALVDALGILLVALALRVPLAVPIGVLVFVGAFVPIVGAAVSGFVAVIVALVAHGPIVALLMLGGVVLVQQLESHVLQPFLLGRAVSIHPLAVILAVAAGVLLAGIIGALVAVPIVASLNAVVQHLAESSTGPDPDPALGDDAALT